MADPFLAEIRVFPYNFAPTGWLPCDGQLLSISQNTALFSLLGVSYGGDGRTTFGLPDLRGRFPMGAGPGPGLSERLLGQRVGSETVALTTAHMPSHNHGLRATTSANTSNPSGAALANVATNGAAYRTPGVLVASGSRLADAGGSLPHENRQPGLALTFCIAMHGVYPPRP